MKDADIVQLYFSRNESAIEETQKSYGRYLQSLLFRIIPNREDCEECENDVYLAAWNQIPPEKPQDLRTYLAKIARCRATDVVRKQTAEKRGGSEVILSLEELTECAEIADEKSDTAKQVEDQMATEELTKAIDSFLRTLPENERRIFVRRYWYYESVKELSEHFGYTESHMKVTLFRTREKLRKYLAKEGIRV